MTSFKDRLMKSDHVWKQLLDNQNLIGSQVIDGSTAGSLAVSKIRLGDNIISVVDVLTGDDLTAEFSITGDGVINNAGGTDTTGDKLQVLFEQWAVR